MRALACFLALAAGSCATTQPLPSSPTADFDPFAFFSARAEGAGTIHKLFSAPVALRVQTRASPDHRPDRLAVVQTISEGSRPARRRYWMMNRVAPGRFEGRLTPDAVGPVTMTINGSRALIRYRMKGGLDVRQELALQPRTDTLCNRLEVFKFGVPVAWVGERIERSGWMPLLFDDHPPPPPVICPGA